MVLHVTMKPDIFIHMLAAIACNTHNTFIWNWYHIFGWCVKNSVFKWQINHIIPQLVKLSQTYTHLVLYIWDRVVQYSVFIVAVMLSPSVCLKLLPKIDIPSLVPREPYIIIFNDVPAFCHTADQTIDSW